MTSSGRIHIFLGAPLIPALSGGAEENAEVKHYIETWKEQRCIYQNQRICFQSENIAASHDGAEKQQLQETYTQGESGQQVHTISHAPANTMGREKERGSKSMNDLLFITQHAQATPDPKRSPLNLNNIRTDDLHAALPKRPEEPKGTRIPCENLLPSTNTEFLSVFTSSQVAVLGSGHVYEQDDEAFEEREINNLGAEMALGFNQENAVSSCLFQKQKQEYSDSSLELFTPPTDDAEIPSCKQMAQCQGSMKNSEPKNKSCDMVRTAICKRPRVCEDLPAFFQAPLRVHSAKKVKQLDNIDKHEPKDSRHRNNPKLKSSKRVFLLTQCSEKKREYNVLVTVVHPCYLKEIHVKSGPNAGSLIPLATIVVLDQSDVECKVVLWRSAAFWTLAVFPGDVIMLTNLTVHEDRWSNEILLHSTSQSQLLNLGNCSTVNSEEWSHMVDCTALQELVKYLSVKRLYLTNIVPQKTQKMDSISYIRLEKLQPESLVHSVLKVCGISLLTECVYHYKGQKQNKVILTVEEVKWHTHTMVLWGSCISWCDQIRLKRDHIWDFRYLYTRRNPVSGEIELHTTPWSTCECLFDDDKRAVDFKRTYFKNEENFIRQMDLLSLLEEKCSGEIQIKASISELEFLIPGCRSVFMDHRTQLSDILKFLPTVIYSGCEKCRRELKTDENQVYEQCFFCLPFNKVKTFFRLVLMTIVSGEHGICVNVPSDILEKIFLNISPNLLNKPVAFTTVTYGVIVADLCHSLLAKTAETYLLKIRSNFVLDENSIPIYQEFYLLDFHIEL
ncbi:shieldin complex subunit 2 [Xenopus laevis]|uniref:Shieldin complex subunit 2 n=2 Tax=Xenopus laevis TaxID=8355 RepID=A0A1L8GNC2_XENLA|nr:shieldin complex subunit 2 [Xenopus laevis]OCT85348.1 hypothetical protein XELAEV_18023513mg [Xenopus laevis]